MENLNGNIPEGNHSNYNLDGATISGEKTSNTYTYSDRGNTTDETDVRIDFSNFSYNDLTISSGSGNYHYWNAYSWNFYTNSKTVRNVSYGLSSCGFKFSYGGKTYGGTVTISYSFRAENLTYGRGSFSASVSIEGGETFNISGSGTY